MRIFNTYGPRMLLNDGRIVTNFLKSFFSNKLFYIHGSGKQTRSFCYVMDLVDGILRLCNYNFDDRSTVKDKTFNIGNQTELSINDSVKIMNQVIRGFCTTYSSISIRLPPPSKSIWKEKKNSSSFVKDGTM